MYRFLLSRQWVILTLVALLLIPTMIKLGFWQLHRHEHKVALNKVISQSLTATPVPAESVTAPGQHVEHANLYRRVTAKGTFDTAHEVVVRRRTNADGEVGYHVLTPFDLDDGRGAARQPAGSTRTAHRPRSRRSRHPRRARSPSPGG